MRMGVERASRSIYMRPMDAGRDGVTLGGLMSFSKEEPLISRWPGRPWRGLSRKASEARKGLFIMGLGNRDIAVQAIREEDYVEMQLNIS